jgi:hypothetical protein
VQIYVKIKSRVAPLKRREFPRAQSILGNYGHPAFYATKIARGNLHVADDLHVHEITLAMENIHDYISLIQILLLRR